MPTKAMILASDSHNPEYRPPLTLSPLAIEDFTDEPAYRFTPDGRAEVQMELAQSVVLTPLLQSRLAEFTAARIAREQSRGKDLLPALAAEEAAACNLAWALECTVNKGR
jgi:hypothetical protein